MGGDRRSRIRTRSRSLDKVRTGAEVNRSFVDVVDVHVGGDVHRIVLGGVEDIPGFTVRDKMEYLRDEADGLRKLLLHEPRGGHPSLYADIIVPPSIAGADAGYVIMEMMGYPFMSGTNTMSTAIALLETGRIPMKDGPTEIALEAPAGLVKVTADCQGGKVLGIRYQSDTPSFLYARNHAVDVPGIGSVPFDIAWTGAFYPLVRASDFGFKLVRDEEEQLVRFAKEFLAEARQTVKVVHPVFGDEGPLSFVQFVGEPEKGTETTFECRGCNYVFPGNSVVRSPAGVPTTAMLVQLYDRKKLAPGETLNTTSIFGTSLKATLSEEVSYYGFEAVRAQIEGSGWVTAQSRLVVDFDDPLIPSDGLKKVLSSTARE
ncbi:MAG: proline racemase [Mesorhizobium sp.]|nr:MAG: proline racemase [Mesorhizobium sp.]RWB81788.1 MAG: proline racemase [Mesorhizobium sp.]RWF77939.1 MAG: proline racemase [Mesorhizobium sp.]TIS68502.1 MAG: proline racemase [Mesorhizobium sp.]TIW51059.1 MAG: proline racemase [Mesorhizobium sp.]